MKTMADLARMPAFMSCRQVMKVVDIFSPTSGYVDASNPSAIVVRFPVASLGHPRTVADSAISSFADAGFDLVRDDSNDRDANFVLADRMAA
jgi:hypothetical protein